MQEKFEKKLNSAILSYIKYNRSFLQVLQCDKPKKKTPPSSGPPPSMPPRQRASTLGVITEILDGSSKQGLPPSTLSSGGSRTASQSRYNKRSPEPNFQLGFSVFGQSGCRAVKEKISSILQMYHTFEVKYRTHATITRS